MATSAPRMPSLVIICSFDSGKSNILPLKLRPQLLFLMCAVGLCGVGLCSVAVAARTADGVHFHVERDHVSVEINGKPFTALHYGKIPATFSFIR